MELSLRLARAEEIDIYERFIKEAIDFQHSIGLKQWSENYPTVPIVKEDISENIGFALTVGDQPVGYFALTFDGDEEYEKIDGKWKTNLPYATVHRMMFGNTGRGKGYAIKAFDLIKKCCRDKGISVIKIDTKYDNAVMRHILEKQGFVHCGTVNCDGPKMAYELDF